MQKSNKHFQSEKEIEELFEKGANADSVYNVEIADKLRDIKERNASQKLLMQIANMGVKDRESNLMSAVEKSGFG